MAAAKLNITVEQGTTWNHTLQLKSANLAFDLTGYIARMQLRKTIDSPIVLLSLTQNAGITIFPLLGTLVLKITATQTASIMTNSAVYDLEIEDGTGEVIRVIQGVFTFSKEVTR